MSGLFGLNGNKGSEQNLSNAFESPDEAGMLGSNSIVNDTCFRLDLNAVFTLIDLPANIAANWKAHPSTGGAAGLVYSSGVGNATGSTVPALEAISAGIFTADYPSSTNQPQQVLNNVTPSVVEMYNTFGGVEIGFWNYSYNQFQVYDAGAYLINATVSAESISVAGSSSSKNTLNLLVDIGAAVTTVAATAMDNIVLSQPLITKRIATLHIQKTIYLNAGERVQLNFAHVDGDAAGYATLNEKSLSIQKIVHFQTQP
jgi:hypothetical protein